MPGAVRAYTSIGERYYQTDYERYCLVLKKLRNHKNEDDTYEELKFSLTNAIFTNMYCSEEVRKIWKDAWDFPKRKSKFVEIFKIFETNGHWTKDHLEVIRRKTSKIIFDHIVPVDVFLKELLRAFSSNELTFEKFLQMRNKINVCYITKEEDERLTKAGLREKMPESFTWETGNGFERYETVGIKIHNHD